MEASSYNSDETPRLGTSIGRRCGPEKTKIKEASPAFSGLLPRKAFLLSWLVSSVEAYLGQPVQIST